MRTLRSRSLRWLLVFVMVLGSVALLRAATAPRKDYYKILNVRKEATDKQIRKAYYQLAREFHPDKTGADSLAASKYHELTEAYETLSDADKRRKYDLGSDTADWPHARWNHPEHHRLFSETLDITGANWGYYIDRAEPGERWMILFYRDSPDRIQLMAQWDEAYNKLDGIVRFGRVNIDTDRFLTMQMRVRYEPCIVTTVIGTGNWKYHTGAMSTDAFVSLASEIYSGERLSMLDSYLDLSSTVLASTTTSEWQMRLLIISDTSRVPLKYRHLSTVIDGRAKIYYTSTWSNPKITKTVQRLFAATVSVSAPGILFVDPTAGNLPENVSYIHAGTRTWTQLQSEISSQLSPLFPRFTAKNYVELCRVDTLCILFGTKQKNLQNLPRYSAAARQISTQFALSLQFGWIDIEEMDEFSAGFNLEATSDSISIVLFDRSRFEYHVVAASDAALANILSFDPNVVASKLAKYTRGVWRNRQRFMRFASPPPFRPPTLLMQLLSWPALGIYAVLVALVYLSSKLRSILTRLFEQPKRQPASDKSNPQPKPQFPREKDESDSADATATAETSSSESSATEPDVEQKTTNPASKRNHEASESSGDDSEHEDASTSSSTGADEDSTEELISDLVRHHGWLNILEKDMSSLKHSLIFVIFDTKLAPEQRPSAIPTLAECSRAFAHDPIHFATHEGSSELLAFIDQNCAQSGELRFTGIALHSKRCKYVLFSDDFADLKDWLQRLMEGNLRFSQLSADLKWPKATRNVAATDTT